jgi:hypothetical protein
LTGHDGGRIGIVPAGVFAVGAIVRDAPRQAGDHLPIAPRAGLRLDGLPHELNAPLGVRKGRHTGQHHVGLARSMCCASARHNDERNQMGFGRLEVKAHQCPRAAEGWR